MSPSTVLHKLWVGLCLRCPHCEKGATFRTLFTPHTTCAFCGYQFEKRDGESVGGMYINLVVGELLTFGGYLAVEAAADLPVIPHMLFWAVFNVLFLLLFYRHSRSIWMSITYMAGGAEENAL